MVADVTVVPGLPADHFGEAALGFAARISTADGSRPPELRRFLLDANRNLRFDFEGIGICRAARKPGSRLELSGCRSALVGTGSVDPEYDVQARQPVCCDGRVLIYNGGLVNGQRRLWVRFNVSLPEPAIEVESLDVKRAARPYPTQLVLSIAKMQGGDSLSSFSLRLGKGAFGTCPAAQQRFRVSGVFADGTRAGGRLISRCLRG